MTTTSKHHQALLSGPHGTAEQLDWPHASIWVDLVDPLAEMVSEWLFTPVGTPVGREVGPAPVGRGQVLMALTGNTAPVYGLALVLVDTAMQHRLRAVRMPRTLGVHTRLVCTFDARTPATVTALGHTLAQSAVGGGLPMVPRTSEDRQLWISAAHALTRPG